MAISVNVSSVWKNVNTSSVNVAGVWKTAQVYTRVAGVWKPLNVLTATVDSTTATGTGVSPGGVASDTRTAAGVDGSGSYTYLWSYVSGSASITCNSANTAGTNWLFTSGSPGTENAVWRCAVSDGVDTVYTSNVSITLTLT